jgi:peptidoglycan hydrolase CwlO-like protein
MNQTLISKIHKTENRLDELETENEYLEGDIEFLHNQLDKNLTECQELYTCLAELHKESLKEKIVDFKSEFGVDIEFDADFNLEPEDK